MTEIRYLKFRRNTWKGPGYVFCEMAGDSCVQHVERYQGQYFLGTGGLTLDWSSIDEAAHAALRDAKAWELTSQTFEAVLAEANSFPHQLQRKRRAQYGWPFWRLMQLANSFLTDEWGLRYGRGVFAAGMLLAASLWILGWWTLDSNSFKRDAGTSELPWQAVLAFGAGGTVLWGHLLSVWVRLVRLSRAFDDAPEEVRQTAAAAPLRTNPSQSQRESAEATRPPFSFTSALRGEPCPVCGYRYSRRELAEHVRTEHPNNDQLI